MRLPSGLNAALTTIPSWPLSGSPIGCRLRRPRSAPSCLGRGDDALAVGAERGALAPVLVAPERLADRLAGRGVPDPRRLVLGRGDDALAVRAERRALHNIIMAFERLADRLAGRRVPDPRRLVLRRGDDALAVGAERRAVTRSPVALERLADRLPGRGVPDPRRLVLDAVTMRLPSGLNAALTRVRHGL